MVSCMLCNSEGEFEFHKGEVDILIEQRLLLLESKGGFCHLSTFLFFFSLLSFKT